MSLRLLLAARKSRKGTGDATDYERQDHRAKEWAESEGHTIIHPTADTVSSQSAPWKRKQLGPWMRDPQKLAMYDAILISDTDRISRGTDEDFHYIEDWCYRNGKSIIVARGPQFPARDGAMGESDRYQWIAQKRAARTYWESVRDKHADTREIIRANGGAIGRAPFGYAIEGPKLRKSFVPDPVNGPLAREVFQRIADGRTAASVAVWLSGQTGKTWRVKSVADMIRRRTYLGERDGHVFEPLVSEALWDSANAALESRSFKRKDKGGRRAVHGYSGLIYCECGAQMYRHQSDRGSEKYRCGRGRRGIAAEGRCEFGGILFTEANAAVDALMSEDLTPEYVMVTTGGDYGRQQELKKVQDAMNAAVAKGDMVTVAKLMPVFTELQNRPVEPVRTMPRRTGRTNAEVWNAGTLSDRRGMLEGWKGVYFVTVAVKDGAVVAMIDEAEEFPRYAA